MNDLLIQDIANNFHFLRPYWFYAMIPALLIFLLMHYRQSQHSNWETAIDPHLLSHLLDNPQKRASRSPLSIVFIAWVLGIVALAGPVWRQTPQPVHERQDALVVVFDLSRSMLATDVKPDRLVRAKRKLIDLLEKREEGVTALVVFAGDAHTVSPLTDDTNTIAAMISSLSPDIIPAPGSQLSSALKIAIDLFDQASVASGRILIITDEIRDVVASQRVARAFSSAYPVSVLSVGTAEGAPVPLYAGQPNAGYLKDANGRLVIPKLDADNLRNFAELAGGRYSPMSLTDEDLNYLLSERLLESDTQFRTLERDFDVWFEEGPWLLLLLLPIAALAFRRGWVWCLALVFVFPSNSALAFDWTDLWQTPDEQGMNALKAGETAKAAELFESNAWRATANYRSGNFEDAANQFGQINNSDGKYNLGNALARQGLFNEAIEAYDHALSLDPDNDDAEFNKKLIEDLLEQQQQENENERDQEQEQNEQDSDQNQSQDQQDSDQDQSQDQEDSDQDQSKDQAEQEKNDKQQQDETEQQKEQTQENLQEQPEINEEQTSPLDEEERQALQQWLRRVPDDPGGLLRRKFQQQHEKRVREGKVATNDTSDW